MTRESTTTSQAIESYLVSFGGTSDAVAANLLRHGCRGQMDASGRSDPVAVSLMRAFPGEEVEVLARHAYVGRVYGVIPEVVREFTEQFLLGRHPKLVSVAATCGEEIEELV